MQGEISRKHFALLRRYWHAGRQGLASQGGNLALDLTALGYLQQSEQGYGGLVLCITPKGIEALQQQVNAVRATQAPHHELGEALAQWLRSDGRVVWTNMQFCIDNPQGRHICRPDVFSIEATHNPDKITPTVHEIKVSRGDFLRDVANPHKRGLYREISERFYYVAPDGMLSPQEMPESAGLIAQRASSFVVLKRAKLKRIALTPQHYLHLILKNRNLDEEAVQ
jgi:hypothetical protein